jgi:DNA-directed RNA polymerase subunit RPC12/RpoP
MQISRSYECRKCKHTLSAENEGYEFQKRCPKCGKNTLIITNAKSSVSFINEAPRTLGMLASKNSERKEKNGEPINGFFRRKPSRRKV